MCYVFVIYFLQPNNCKFAAKHVSTAKPAIKVLSKLVAAVISVSCSCTNFFAVPFYMFAANQPIS